MDQIDSESAFPAWATSTPILILASIAFLAALVMIPSALASWYSKCYKISLIYGFAIVFSAVLVGLISLLFPEKIRNYMHLFNTLLMACLVIYGVFLQFTGKCNLGK